MTDNTIEITVDPEDVRFDGQLFTVTIDPDDFDLISSTDAVTAKADAVEEAERQTRQDIWWDARSALDNLLRLAEMDRLDDAVPTTDLLLHGPAVAAIREAIAIVADIVKAEEVKA